MAMIKVKHTSIHTNTNDWRRFSLYHALWHTGAHVYICKQRHTYKREYKMLGEA
jgi:hypothetical protein